MNSKRLGLLLSAVCTVIATTALLAPAAMATTPAKGYERFAGCPSPEEIPTVLICQRTVINGGHFQMGSKDVPITNPITLSGGVLSDLTTLAATSKGGMSAAKQQVPGGIIGITGLDWLVNFLNLEGLKLYAVTELAGGPKLGPAFQSVSLPIRVHLENPILGNNCYVGSFTNPIKLNLTYGTTTPPAPNKPITGKIPTPGTSDLPEVFTVENGVLVDNSFSAPGASGCVLNLFGFIPISINGLVNSQSGLPAAAGTNETKQNVAITEIVEPSVVYP